MFRSLRPALLLAACCIAGAHMHAQDGLPHALDPSEVHGINQYRLSRADQDRGITTPPPFSPRTMAEWEEVQTLCIAWISFPTIQKQIVRYAKEECQVLILCAASGTNSQANISTYLLANNAGGAPLPNLNNVSFLVAPYNSIWMRDYGAECIYQNEVDSLFLLDWIYNRPRPQDDVSPDAIGALKGINVFNTSTAPNDLVHTGGNFMADGFGTAFSSNLVIDENGAGGVYNQTVRTPAQVDAMMTTWMGINSGRYIRMATLPFDGIHHIDMHMKLLDEETLLIGQFPAGVSDGPQIESNIAFIQNNYTSVFGTPYRIVRVPMPPGAGSTYAPNASYRTFTNSIFINKTILVPTYAQQYDTTALRIYREQLPGYRVIAIDCDETSGNIIAQSGALHCITKAIGVAKPLLMRHQRLADQVNTGAGYGVSAYLRHKNGIASAEVYWSTDTANGYTALPMSATGGNNWSATIPLQPEGSYVYYYIRAVANNGKVQVRPISAPTGCWRFRVLTSPGLPIAAKLFLEGPYDAVAGLMRDDLRVAGLVPPAEPFTAAGFTLVNNTGTTMNAAALGTVGANAIVDWVLIEARDAATPATVVQSRVALLQRDGDVVALDGVSNVRFALAGNYTIAVRHRNHFGALTTAPVTLAAAPVTVDFRSPALLTYGTEARKTIGAVCMLWAGDVQRDGQLKYTGAANDRDAILTLIGGTAPNNTLAGYHAQDVNLDGWVKYTGLANDRDPILTNVGSTVPTNIRYQQLP